MGRYPTIVIDTKGKRGKYKTREDIRFCKGRPCKQKYHYRKKAGWPGYV